MVASMLKSFIIRFIEFVGQIVLRFKQCGFRTLSFPIFV